MMTVLSIVGLLLVGLGLLAAEILVIPGFGLIGILGLGFGVGSITMAFTQLGGVEGVITLVAGGAAFASLAWLLPRTRAGKAMVLNEGIKARASLDLSALVGREGETVTPLRPSGSVRLDGQVVDVVADGVFVEAGTRVRVARVEGSRVLVEPLTMHS